VTSPTATASLARPPAIATARLVLRELQPSDAAAVAAGAGDRRVAQYLIQVPSPYPIALARRWVMHRIAWWELGRGVTFAVTLPDEPDMLLGTVSLRCYVRDRRAELGYWLAYPAWGHGFATEAAQAAVGREYPALFRAASWLLPLSYLLSATLAPVLPHRLAAVGVSAGNGTAIAALWMLARFATLAIMWRVGSWHGRWGTLVLAIAALAGGTSLVLLGSRLPLVVIGLIAFGAGMGLTYYAALYYSLAVGHAAVDAGGSFEALIGVGYCVGPLLGLGGHVVASGADANLATVALATPVVLFACAAALRSYRGARRARRT